MHPLLKRQLRRHAGIEDGEAHELAPLLRAISDAYRQADADRGLLERSLELTSEELLARNEQLRRDLEERARLEVELQHAEKMRAVGQLAAGIAHEINTPLQFVTHSFEFLRETFDDLISLFSAYERLRSPAQVGDAREARTRIAAIDALSEELDAAATVESMPSIFRRTWEGIRRVTQIVSALKDFAHPSRNEKSAVDLNRVLRTALTMARSEVKYVAEVQDELEELPAVYACPGQLHQVFLNLIINAGHAIGERYQGTGRMGRLTIRSRRAGAHVEIAVADDGGGIPEDVQDRIFEPFFTTKPVGKGTGQGLAIARAMVVDRHHGSLRFESQVGAGTTFTVRLPIQAPAEAALAEVAGSG